MDELKLQINENLSNFDENAIDSSSFKDDLEINNLPLAMTNNFSVSIKNGSFWSQVNSYPILSKEEENILFNQYRLTGEVHYLNKIILSHLRLVVKVASVYKNYLINRYDLLSEGLIGLISAVKKFDIKKNVRFATYAIFWIKHSIQQYIINNVSFFKISSNAENKRSFFGSKTANKKESSNSSLKDVPVQHFFEDNSFANVPSDDVDLESKMLYESRKKALKDTMNKIYEDSNETNKYIMKHRILTDNKKTLKEISVALGRSEEGVRVVEKKILSKIKKELLDF